MALSEIIINDVVLAQTKIAISESDYPTLRQYLLERKPLLPVTNRINSLLSELCSTDKKTSIHHLTQQACISQINSDHQEIASDEQERNNDNALKLNYNKELLSLENRISQLDLKCFHQQNVVNQLSRELNELKLNRSEINRTINRIYNERHLLHSRYLQTSSYPHGNVHRHPNSAPFAHIHHISNVHVHLHSPTTIVYSFEDQLTWNRLLLEENGFIEEEQRLTRIIDAKIIDCSKEEINLSQLLNDKKQTNEYCIAKRHQINIDLPNKERNRQIRNQERIARQNAQATNDPTLQQLSYNNHEKLKQQITNKNDELDNKQSQLMGETMASSYSVYISQLELALRKTDVKVNVNERVSLRMILTKIKTLIEMEKSEQNFIRSLNKEKNNLSILKDNLTQNTNQLNLYATEPPKLIAENESLTAQNKTLTLNSDSAGNLRKKALYLSLFGTSVSLLSAGLVSLLAISPLFFAIPGVLGLLTLVSLTVALVYHIKKSTSDQQLNQNKDTIFNNESTIVTHGQKGNELNQTIIPTLTVQINNAEQTVAQIEIELKNQQEAMSQLIKEAENVTSTHSGNDTFFRSTVDNVSSFPEPSAPPLPPAYESEDQPNFRQI